MSIEGQMVELASFGSIDYKDPSVGVIRFWNVLISMDKPGAISVEESGFGENNNVAEIIYENLNDRSGMADVRRGRDRIALLEGEPRRAFELHSEACSTKQ
jgi:hypothetical protein